MCWSCACGALESAHDDSRCLTTESLQDAAEHAGTDIPGVIANLVMSLGHYNPAMKGVEGVDTPYAACQLIKTTEERRFTLGVAYPAMRADIARAADGFRDFVSPEVLEKTAWDWLTKHREVNMFHQEHTVGHFTPTESYIWRAPTWEIPSPVDGKKVVIKQGSWMLGGIWDEYGWTLVKAGLINGWSPEGGARRSTPTPERLALVEV